MNKREQTILGVKMLSVRMMQATDEVIEAMPEEMDMENLLGLVGNVCLRYGVTDKQLKTFTSGLTEFVEVMDEALKSQKH